MGAWGVLAFDNDDANDWAYDLENTDDLSLVEAAIRNVEEAGSAYLDQGLACNALAACEVLARLRGQPGYRNAYTENVDLWVTAHPVDPPPSLVDRAVAAIDRVVGEGSELRELWDESEPEPWLMAVADLRVRLSGAAPANLPRPQPGNRRFEFIGGNSEKFWEINQVGAQIIVHFGRIGTNGQTQTKDLGTEGAAKAQAERLIREKLGKGYRELTTTPPAVRGAAEPGSSPPGPWTRPPELQRWDVPSLPPDGPATLGGIALPAGQRLLGDPRMGPPGVDVIQDVPVVWVTVEPVEASGPLLHSLRAAGESAGLVPMLLAGLDSDPSRPWMSREFGPTDPRRVDHFAENLQAVLVEMWLACFEEADEESIAVVEPFGLEFPGMAPAMPPSSPPSGFARLLRRTSPPPDDRTMLAQLSQRRIALIASPRPADALTAVGWLGATNVHQDPAPISAVLRSWEDRFDARLVEIGFDTLTLTVGRPPTDLQSALALAAEHFALCPDNVWQGVGTLRAYAGPLIGGRLWSFWWD